MSGNHFRCSNVAYKFKISDWRRCRAHIPVTPSPRSTTHNATERTCTCRYRASRQATGIRFGRCLLLCIATAVATGRRCCYFAACMPSATARLSRVYEMIQRARRVRVLFERIGIVGKAGDAVASVYIEQWFGNVVSPGCFRVRTQQIFLFCWLHSFAVLKAKKARRVKKKKGKKRNGQLARVYVLYIYMQCLCSVCIFVQRAKKEIAGKRRENFVRKF